MRTLKKLLEYGNSVYHIREQINGLERKNLDAQTTPQTAVKTMMAGMLCHRKSLNEIVSEMHEVNAFKGLHKRGEYVPKAHGLRDALIDIPYKQISNINDRFIAKLKENKYFRNNTIDGLRTVAVDGVTEITTYKNIEGLLEMKTRKGETKKYYKTLAYMYLGGKTPVLVAIKELQLKDVEQIEKGGKKITAEEIKAEGEITVLKNSIKEVAEKVGGIDVIVIDAIGANAPVFNALKDLGIDTVVRFKDKRRDIYKDAIGLFKGKEPVLRYKEIEEKERITVTYKKKNSKKKNYTETTKTTRIEEITKEEFEEIETTNDFGKWKTDKDKVNYKENKTRKVKIVRGERTVKVVEVWDDEFELNGYEHGKVRFIRYLEYLPEKMKERRKKKKERNGEKSEDGPVEILVMTTLLKQALPTILKIMESRWIIENNGFRTLKSTYGMDHCFIGEINAIRLIDQIRMLVYNLVNLYVKVRTKTFTRHNISLKTIGKILYKDFIEEKKIYMYFADIKTSK